MAAAALLLALLLPLSPAAHPGAHASLYESRPGRAVDAGGVYDAKTSHHRAVRARSAPRLRRSLAGDARGDGSQLPAAAAARRAADVDIDELYAAPPDKPPSGPPDQPDASPPPQPGGPADRLAQCRARYAAFLPVMHEELMLWAVHGINESLMDAAFTQQTHLNFKAGLPIVFRCAAQWPGSPVRRR
jgi:hypothetical protein